MRQQKTKEGSEKSQETQQEASSKERRMKQKGSKAQSRKQREKCKERVESREIEKRETPCGNCWKLAHGRRHQTVLSLSAHPTPLRVFAFLILRHQKERGHLFCYSLRLPQHATARTCHPREREGRDGKKKRGAQGVTSRSAQVSCRTRALPVSPSPGNPSLASSTAPALLGLQDTTVWLQKRHKKLLLTGSFSTFRRHLPPGRAQAGTGAQDGAS